MPAALLGLLCVVAAAGILVALHFLPTGLNPIRYAVSDYGWTRYSLGYRSMVVLLGVGALLIAYALSQTTDATSLHWLVLYGVVRILIVGFMTDREPAGLRSLSRTGLIHILLAGTAFVAIALAASNIEWTGKPEILDPLGRLVSLTAIATGIALVAPRIRQAALGIVERSQYATAIAWLIVTAASIA